MEETVTHSQQLPGIDRKKSLRLVPQAGNNPVTQVRPQADVWSVRPKGKNWGHLQETHTAREAIPAKPPPKVPKTVQRPRHRSRRIQPIPRAVKTNPERMHPQAATWNQMWQEDSNPRSDCHKQAGGAAEDRIRRRSPQPGDAIWRCRSHKSPCVDDHPEITYHRRRREGTTPGWPLSPTRYKGTRQPWDPGGGSPGTMSGRASRPGNDAYGYPRNEERIQEP